MLRRLPITSMTRTDILRAKQQPRICRCQCREQRVTKDRTPTTDQARKTQTPSFSTLEAKLPTSKGKETLVRCRSHCQCLVSRPTAKCNKMPIKRLSARERYQESKPCLQAKNHPTRLTTLPTDHQWSTCPSMSPTDINLIIQPVLMQCRR
jgi:hypothetical protein